MTTTTKQTTKPAGEIGRGDIIMFLGTPHLVDSVESYTHPTLGPTVGIARSADGWGMTLFAATDRVAVA